MDLKKWHKFCIIVILFCLNSCVLSSHNTCSPGIDFPGYTEPHGDIVIEYGDPLDIKCVWNGNPSEHDNTSLLTFKRNNETIPPEMITVVNSTVIKLHIDKPPKVSADTYTCLLNNTSDVVCMNVVSVGTKPQKVSDFSCISSNFDNLTCTWTAPENYVRTNYYLTYRLGSRSARYSNDLTSLIKLPDSNDPDKRLSCFLNISTTPHYRQVHEIFYFNLTMRNKFGTETIDPTVNHFAHVLSAPPENLTFISATPSSICLSWIVPTSMQVFPPGVHHRIEYQCEYGKKEWQFGGVLKHKKFNKEATFNLTNLEHAHALCDIRVALRSAAAFERDETMWSRNASITVRTSSKIPDGPPQTNVGSFEIVAFGRNLQYREAYIYWKQIPEEQRNGPEFEYVIVENDHNFETDEQTGAYAKFKNLSISSSYNFNVWSRNSNGRSTLKSTIHVPKQIERIKEPSSFTKVEFGDGRYELTWEAPKLPPGEHIANYTIFWCSNERDRPYQCTGNLDWQIVSNDTLVFNGTVADNKIYQFAISANTHNSSSGMLWAACTVIHNKNMGKLKNVWINRLGSTYIEVGWKLDCSDRIGSVEGYVIYYCPIKSPLHTECKGPQENVTFHGDTTILGGNITNLSPYTTYMLSVSVITKGTTFSQQSDPLYNTTLEAAPSQPQNVTIVTVTNSTISLRWDQPKYVNGILRDYWVCYKSTNEDVVEKVQHTNFTLVGLRSYENYLITIKACTVSCSSESKVLNVTTEMGYPSQIRKPTVDRRNDSSITIVWGVPLERSGRNDYYLVKFKQKHAQENVTLQYNVTHRKYVIENCGDGGKFNTFYVSARAVNVIGNKSYSGPWSDELENYCETPANYITYVMIVVVVAFMGAMAFLSNRLYKHCKIMRDVEVKLPPGLAPGVTDHTLVPWSIEKHLETKDHHAPPDEELLLVKMSEGRQFSGDSSGCSSGHESVTSSLESGTRISSSDSGTEQHPGSFCVLGVDPNVDAYVPVTPDPEKPPYKTCDVISESSPYVVTGDPVKTVNPGYIPFSQTEPIGKSSGYIVAGIKNCNGYILTE